MSIAVLQRTWTERPPEGLDGVQQFISKEGLPIWRWMLNTLKALVAAPALPWTDFVQNIGPGTSGHFDITGLTNLTANKNAELVQTAQPIASRGGARDEFEMDDIRLTGYVVDATTIRVYWHSTGVVFGDYAFAYRVGI